jgi:23S rRNA (cytidine1920-2'-O)/16S rRNA (cytidine1409-2'-O)-methyltransferase
MTDTNKLRLDALLVKRGLADTRAKAKALVMAGLVYSGERRLDKPGQPVAAGTPVQLRGREHPWVSRGGVKLAHGLDAFDIEVAGRIGLDVGASTGGFTDVLLSRGATKVYAVDVGHGVLDWSLRNDERVIVLERTNARSLTRNLIPEAPEIIVCDASFIGLETVLPAALALAARACALVALIKPQFEVGRGRVGKGGVVRDTALHEEVCARIEVWLAAQMGWQVLGVVRSPIDGPAGNKEFLIAARIEA